MENEARIKEIKKRLKAISVEQRNLDKQIQRQEEEEDYYYDESLYKKVDTLEDERNNLSMELEALENN